MSTHLVESAESKAGVAGGFILSVLANLNSVDILSTILLAAIGAIVSFVVTIVCKQIQRQVNKYKGRKPSV